MHNDERLNTAFVLSYEEELLCQRLHIVSCMLSMTALHVKCVVHTGITSRKRRMSDKMCEV
jgi:hypothetical protein